MPNDLPPGTASPSFPPGDRLRRWAAVYQQAQRWLAAGCFEALADDLRAVLRLAAGRAEEPSAVIIDSRTLRSSPGKRHAAAMTEANARKARNGSWRSTHWAISWPCRSHQPEPMIALRLAACCRKPRRGLCCCRAAW